MTTTVIQGPPSASQSLSWTFLTSISGASPLSGLVLFWKAVRRPLCLRIPEHHSRRHWSRPVLLVSLPVLPDYVLWAFAATAPTQCYTESAACTRQMPVEGNFCLHTHLYLLLTCRFLFSSKVPSCLCPKMHSLISLKTGCINYSSLCHVFSILVSTGSSSLFLRSAPKTN